MFRLKVNIYNPRLCNIVAFEKFDSCPNNTLFACMTSVIINTEVAHFRSSALIMIIRKTRLADYVRVGSPGDSLLGSEGVEQPIDQEDHTVAPKHQLTQSHKIHHE